MGEVAASYSGLKKLKRAADAAAHRIVVKAKATAGLAKKARIPAVQDFSALAHIDEHVVNTPPSAEESLESLAEYLASGAQTDLEKVRAVYKWIIANVSYDADGFYGKRPKLSPEPEEVLKNRCCVCNGYARLMVRLCQLMDVECMEIIGYAKGSDYNQLEPDLASTDPDHAWNVVKLDGTWRFVEATWGAGNLNSKQQFVRDETDFHFLTDPEIFAESHFPYMDADMEASKKWQLLKKPIDLDTFHRRARRSKECFECEVELVSHKQALIDVEDGEVTLRFRGAGKPLSTFSAKFVEGPSWEANYLPGKHAITVRNHRTNEVTVIARPPTTGSYWELNVYGTTDSESPRVSQLVSYHIRTQEEPEGPVFPDGYHYFGLYTNPEDCGFTKDFPQSGFHIQADGGRHELTIPIAGKVRPMGKVTFAEDADEDQRISAVEVNDTTLTVRLRMWRVGHYALNLFCAPMDSPDNHCEHVARFLIECKHPLAESVQYPNLRDFYGLYCNPNVCGLPDDFNADCKFVISADSGEQDLTFPVSRPICAMARFKSADECSKDNSEFALVENLQGSLRVCLRMHQPGFHCLELFCKRAGSQAEEKFALLAAFLVECREPMPLPRPFPDRFPYPGVILESPRDGELPANSEVEFRLTSETLATVLVNENIYEKEDSSFSFTVKTEGPGKHLSVYGAEESEATSFFGLFNFRVV